MSGLWKRDRIAAGDQGMMLMGDILAKAAGLKEGNEILLLKSYGPEDNHQ